jgi:DNA-binding MarR family transcriptional regulator
VTASKLCATANVTPRQVQRRLRRLLDLKLIAITDVHEQNGRSCHYFLTARGLVFIRKHKPKTAVEVVAPRPRRGRDW